MSANTNSGNSDAPSKQVASYEDKRTAEEEVESEKIFEKLATSPSKNCSSYPSKTNTQLSSAESDKLKASESQSSSSDDDGQEELLGPGLQEPAVPSKSSSGHASTFRARKRRRVGEPSSSLLLSELPGSGQYIRSFMHRDIVTHVLASTRTGFGLSASIDGQVKFWVRDLDGKSNSLEFVKQFRAHAGPLLSFELSLDEKLLLTMGAKDRTLRIFSVESFDMLEFVRLPYVPSAAAFVSKPRAPAQEVAVAQTEGKKVKVNIIRIGEIASQTAVMDNEEKETASSSASSHREIPLPHVAPVSIMRYNARYDAVISIDRRGLIEYWRPGQLDEDNDGEDSNIRLARRDDIDGVKFRFKAETDLFELAKNSVAVTSVTISPDGEHFAVRARDRSIRVFKFVTGRMVYVYVPASGMEKEDGNEDGEFDARIARRLARERQLIEDMSGGDDEDHDMTGRPFGNALFDSSGRLLLFATVLGIQVVCLKTTNVLRTLGEDEAAERFLVLALFSTSSSKVSSDVVENADKRNDDTEINAENIASGNAKNSIIKKPLLISSAYDSQRLFLFSNDSPDADSMTERDIFNERPVSRARGRLSSRVEQDVNSNNAATMAERVTLHTSAGDIMVRLYKQMSKTVLNFSTHAKNGYYNRVEFHRVIKGFMVQTGDPTGSGSGGESIWGTDFEDEIDSALKHTSGTLSMANAGANTNASQFFITTADTPHLDGKHTIFGKVIKGMGVVHQIENVRVDKKDRPLTPIRIESVSVHYS